MNEPDALTAVIAVCSGSHPFTGANALFDAVEFTPEYPLGEMSIPRVAFTAIGGPHQTRGLGTYQRIMRQDYQVDVLAATMLEARRIFNWTKVVIIADYNGYDGTGEIGYGYLRSKYIRSVTLGTARSGPPWDETGRIKRVLSEMRVEYLESMG